MCHMSARDFFFKFYFHFLFFYNFFKKIKIITCQYDIMLHDKDNVM